jgi:hypothetical protein
VVVGRGGEHGAGAYDWLVVTAEPELWFDDELWLDEEAEPLDVEPLDVEPLEVESLDVEPLEFESLDVALAVVPVSDWPEVVCVESVVAVLPNDPLAAIVPKAMANVASAAATTRRRMIEIRRARARRRSRTRSGLEVGGGVEGMRAS